jgi:hypothetical protein
MQTRMPGPGFAVEVTGVDASRPLSATDAEALRALLDQHELLASWSTTMSTSPAFGRMPG